MGRAASWILQKSAPVVFLFLSVKVRTLCNYRLPPAWRKQIQWHEPARLDSFHEQPYPRQRLLDISLLPGNYAG